MLSCSHNNHCGRAFDISNQTPPDSSQNPATRPHPICPFQKKHSTSSRARSGLSPLYFYDFLWILIPKQCRKDVSRSPRSQKMPLPHCLASFGGAGYGSILKTSRWTGMVEVPSHKNMFWDGLWHWVYHMILNIRAWGCQSTQKLGHTGNEQNWDEQRTWGAGTVMQL